MRCVDTNLDGDSLTCFNLRGHALQQIGGVRLTPRIRKGCNPGLRSTKGGTQGHGLGLSIVNQIITMAGGFIQVDSTRDKGTRIRLHLPLIAGNE